MKPPLLVALLLAVLCLPSMGRAASLRCDTELVSDGATKPEVLMKCGEPIAKEARTEVIKERSYGVQRIVERTIEEWTYNFGPRRFMQIVIFENGRLVDVRSGEYGR